MKSDATKQALQLSVTALILCVATLVGATFAWFTDVAPVSVGKVQAANFDAELCWKDPTDSTGSEWKDVTTTGNEIIFNNVNLPGTSGTVTRYLKIVNNGTAAFDCSLAFKATEWNEGSGSNINVSAKVCSSESELSSSVETSRGLLSEYVNKSGKQIVVGTVNPGNASDSNENDPTSDTSSDTSSDTTTGTYTGVVYVAITLQLNNEENTNANGTVNSFTITLVAKQAGSNAALDETTTTTTTTTTTADTDS